MMIKKYTSTSNLFLVALSAPSQRGALCHGTFGTMVNPAMYT